jgi:hypothetical protein
VAKTTHQRPVCPLTPMATIRQRKTGNWEVVIR